MAKYKFNDPQQALAEAEKRIQGFAATSSAHLNLQGLGLTVLPESIGQLIQLSLLDLDDNRLSELPKSISTLTRLRGLYLSRNPLRALPDWLTQFSELSTLLAAGAQLTALPASIGDLRNLEVLYVPDNQLESIPESIGRLDNLRELFLTANDLRALPKSLRRLSQLSILDIRRNPKLSIPPEVLNQAGPADILDYYFRTRGGARPLNEAKLILLGRGEVGKTSLVDRLVHDKFKRTDMTRGISITHWPIAIDRDTVRLNVWDFGGQEIQHATHQFFLSERSLYLVVLNGRAGAEDEDAEYWLKFVKTFGGSSPTIVVLNKFKVQPFALNRRALQEKYPFIRAFVETDCKPKMKNGIPLLKREIELALGTMEHVRADFPAGWFQIKERLAGMKEPFIAFSDYRKICTELGEHEAQAQERLAEFLNALGIALNFRDDQQLRDETVLNPHWITKGVYQIITSKKLAERLGELRLSDLATILPKKSYPARMHGFLIELMRKFDLCFPYHDDPKEHRYLVPELLEKDEPELKETFSAEECLNFRYDYRLMPEGLLPRFITRTHTMSEPAERWRTGVVLRWEGGRALVKGDKQERLVLVRVLGEPEKRRRLLAVIRENFDQIHNEMKEFKPTEWVALEGHPEEWLSYRELEGLQRNQVTELPKSIGDELVSVDVTKLLNDTDVARAAPHSSRVDMSRPLKLFISYAHQDERWRAKLAPNLGLLQREGLIEIWCDLQIRPGDNWDAEIKRKLEEADLYLFLMSVDLLNSDYVQKTELPIAMQRHGANKARLIPVVARRCGWGKYVGDIQGLPSGGTAIKEWRDKDQAMFDVEEGLRKTIAALRASWQKSTTLEAPLGLRQ